MSRSASDKGHNALGVKLIALLSLVLALIVFVTAMLLITVPQA